MHKLLPFALLVLAAPASAQEVRPLATLDSASILIGQQAHVDLRVSYRVDQGATPAIEWPAIADTLTAHIAVVHDSHLDTVAPQKDKDPYLLEQTRTLTITSWDSGYWAIPPFVFVIDGDTVETNALLLTVKVFDLGYGTISQLLLSGLITFTLGGPVGAFILGVYLFVSIRIFRRHGNEAFSSLRIADYKHWLRLRIDASGLLTIYAIALDRVPRRWRAATRNGEQTMAGNDPRATVPRLIDRVVVKP